MAKKKQAGAELKKKKRIFGPKIGGKIGYKGKKFTNSQKKKRLLGPKNKKKRIFWVKTWGKNLV